MADSLAPIDDIRHEALDESKVQYEFVLISYRVRHLKQNLPRLFLCCLVFTERRWRPSFLEPFPGLLVRESAATAQIFATEAARQDL